MTKTKSQKARAKAARKQQSVAVVPVPSTQLVVYKPPLMQAKSPQPKKPKVTVTRKSNDHGLESMCGVEYASCLANPFDGPLACVPIAPAITTRKYRVFARFPLATNVNGFGFVAATPINGCGNNSPSICCSIVGFVGLQTEFTNPTAGVQFITTNSDYNIGDFNPNSVNQSRVVGYGIRIRYIGSVLNEGGQFFSVSEPNHFPLQAYSNTALATFEECLIQPVARNRWCTLLYKPVSNSEWQLEDDVTFPNLTCVTNTISVNPRAWYMAIGIQSAVASQPFEAEVYAVYEASGVRIRGKTPSHVNYGDFGKVMSATSSPKFDHGANIGGLLKNTIDYIGTNSDKIAKTGNLLYGFGKMGGSLFSSGLNMLSNF